MSKLNFMGSIYINDNIRLYPITIKDVDDIYQSIDSQRDYLREWLPFAEGTKQLSDTKLFVTHSLQMRKENKEDVYVIRKDKKFVGLVGLTNINLPNRKAEIGYWMRNEFQGQGIMTKSVKALCKYAFREMNINRIMLGCGVGNKRSSNVAKRLGFTFEGIERDGEQTKSGTFRDIEIRSLLKKEEDKLEEYNTNINTIK